MSFRGKEIESAPRWCLLEEGPFNIIGLFILSQIFSTISHTHVIYCEQSAFESPQAQELQTARSPRSPPSAQSMALVQRIQDQGPGCPPCVHQCGDCPRHGRGRPLEEDHGQGGDAPPIPTTRHSGANGAEGFSRPRLEVQCHQEQGLRPGQA
jgi:hypothetical protein